MGNRLTTCIQTRGRQERSLESEPLPDVLLRNNPISTAIHMISAPSEHESSVMALILSNNLYSVVNDFQTENGLKCLLEYLQISLPMDSSLSGSITSLILQGASLPSRSFLREVSSILKLNQLTKWMEEFIGDIKLKNIKVGNNSSKHGCVPNEMPETSRKSNDQNIQSSSNQNAVSTSSFIFKYGRSDKKNKKIKAKENVMLIHNACLIIDCLATMICGPNSSYLLNDDIIQFLITCCNISLLDSMIPPKLSFQLWTIVLRSILCFEKFALTRTCKDRICEYLKDKSLPIPFAHMEVFSNSSDMVKREIGFCSQWLLDNTYTIPNRQLTYKSLDRSNLNAIMNIRDASQYIKLSPIGLEVRCDSESFESVRCTFEVTHGVYFYEAQLVSSGIMQIGWATKQSQYMNHEGRGIGDDLYSIAYDGCRRVIWYNGVPHKERNLPKWKPGDVLGCLINIPKKFIIFSLNGCLCKKQTDIFLQAGSGFYAGASFLNNQQCLFNFGREKFHYPPSSSVCSVSKLSNFSSENGLPFKTFNDMGSFSDEDDRIVYPRIVQILRMTTGKPYRLGDGSIEDIDTLHSLLIHHNTLVPGGSGEGITNINTTLLIAGADANNNPADNSLCQICFTEEADTILQPCLHKGFCYTCLIKLSVCPLCRTTIKAYKSSKVFEKQSTEKDDLEAV